MKSILGDPPVASTHGVTAKAASRVVEEHISILREIKAPAPLIEIAERVAAATPPSRGKTKKHSK